MNPLPALSPESLEAPRRPGPGGGAASPARPGLARVLLDCFLCEVRALKPGNVSRHAGGHDMECEDFITSAERVAPILCDPAIGVGRRILESVRATLAAVHCNTNLGMILLAAPLIRAWERSAPASPVGGAEPAKGLSAALRAVLASLAPADGRDLFAAIRLANPGGLGRVEKHDVQDLASGADLGAAMEAARGRDLVARQYANGYREVLRVGAPRLRDYERRWNSAEWACVACYLGYLAQFPDTHVLRKHGAAAAARTRAQALAAWERFADCGDPERMRDFLLTFDRELKRDGINPGACADLTFASLLARRLEDIWGCAGGLDGRPQKKLKK